ncbi:hypothetical protein HMPREF0476_1650 [Kingella kingae ATCC 23330]|uniref:Uncharacterized protein n=1 Tax=Kingella kingae ATCC 23330 TaxID=887327 RepID=F5S8W7_KINKI|nr:hypothetical protein HMPREF0476_1650 [Kingella kingae ATCC 23330]
MGLRGNSFPIPKNRKQIAGFNQRAILKQNTQKMTKNGRLISESRPN